jgi:hypothetical protein
MNIIQLLKDHLPAAIEELNEKIAESYNAISILESRRLQLQRIANAAGIQLADEQPARDNSSNLSI